MREGGDGAPGLYTRRASASLGNQWHTKRGAMTTLTSRLHRAVLPFGPGRHREAQSLRPKV